MRDDDAAGGVCQALPRGLVDEFLERVRYVRMESIRNTPGDSSADELSLAAVVDAIEKHEAGPASVYGYTNTDTDTDTDTPVRMQSAQAEAGTRGRAREEDAASVYGYRVHRYAVSRNSQVEVKRDAGTLGILNPKPLTLNPKPHAWAGPGSRRSTRTRPAATASSTW
jgi:hypothetical protein